jgi:hypothetical protein
MAISQLSPACLQEFHHVGINCRDSVFAMGLGHGLVLHDGGMIHLLLVLMLIVVLVRVLQGRRL